MNNSRVISVIFTVVLATGLVISGCKGASKSTPYQTISASLSPDGSISRVAEFQNQSNLSIAGATFLALTKLQVSRTEKDLYKFTADL